MHRQPLPHLRRRAGTIIRVGPGIAALTLTLALAACSSPGTARDNGGDPEQTAPVAPSSASSSSASSSSTGLPDCGGQLSTLVVDPALTVTGTFPSTLPVTGTGTPEPGSPAAAGTVELSAADGISGTGSPGADVYLVRDGVIVAVPLPQDALGVVVDLAPGETRTLDAALPLVACADGTALAAGRYEAYAAVLVVRDDGGPAYALGGPFPVEIV